MRRKSWPSALFLLMSASALPLRCWGLAGLICLIASPILVSTGTAHADELTDYLCGCTPCELEAPEKDCYLPGCSWHPYCCCWHSPFCCSAIAEGYWGTPIMCGNDEMIDVCLGDVVALVAQCEDFDETFGGDISICCSCHEAIRDNLTFSWDIPTYLTVVESPYSGCCIKFVRANREGTFTVRVMVDDVVCLPDGDDAAVQKTFTIRVGCTNSFSPPKDELCPGEATGASFATCTSGSDIIWSWEPVAEQESPPVIEIEPTVSANGAPVRITAMEGNGEVIVTARDSQNPTCKKEFFIKIGCESCTSCDADGGATAGSGEAKLRSAFVRMRLGLLPGGKSAGSLWMHETEPGTALATRVGLRHALPSGVNGLAYWTDEGGLTQIELPEVVVDVNETHSPSTGYVMNVDFYRRSDVTKPQLDPDRPWDVAGATPFVRWSFTQPDGNDTTVTVLKQSDGDDVVSYTFAYGTGGWTLTTRDETQNPPVVVQEETLTWTEVTPGALYRRRYTARADGVVVSQIETEHASPSAESPWTKRTVDPDGLALTTTRTFVTAGRFAGWEETVVRHDGGWTWYVYSEDVPNGTWTRTAITPWGDAVMPASAPSMPYAGYEAVETTRDETGRVVEVVRYSNGVVTEWTEYVNTYNPYEPDRIEQQVTMRYNDAAGNDYLPTTTVYDSSDPDNEKLDYVLYPDGRRDEHTNYPQASVTFNPGTPLIPPTWQTTGNGTATVVEHLGPTGGPVSGLSTKSVSVRDGAGNTVLDATYAYVGSGYSSIPVEWSVNAYDAAGRRTDTWRSNGTHEHVVYEDCCRTRTVTDAAGTVTRFVHDPLGRPAEQTRFGVAAAPAPLDADIVTSFDYATGTDPVTGQPVRIVTRTVTTTAGDVAPQVSVSRFDVAGRLVSETDAAGLTTSYSYGMTPAGGQEITLTRPDGSTEVTEYYRDGRIRAVYGSGVVPRAYHYEVHEDGRQTTWELLGTADPTAYQSWPRWTRTTYDMLGRVVREERPAFGGGVVETVHHYDGFGRLDCTSATGQADTCYEYDPAMPNLVVRSGFDVDGGGLDVDNPASLDRITETRTRYENAGGWWRVTETWVYDEGDTASGIGSTPAISVQRERLTGFAPGVIRESERYDAYGNVTLAQTLLDPNAPIVTEIIDTPDATQDAERVTVNGLLISSTTQSGVTYSYGYDGLGRRISVADSRTNKPTLTEYNAFGVAAVYTTDDGTPAGTRVTETAYQHDPNTGRLLAVRQLNADDPNSPHKYTRYAYTPRGDVWRIWGDVPQPVEYGYNDFGERVTLTTFRADADWAGESWPTGVTGDTTTWTFDPATGLLTRKEYADGNGTDYTYYPDGKLKTRTWAREAPGGGPLVTYYGYTPTGEMDGIDYEYAGGAPTWDIDFAYDRRGRTVSVTDTTGGTNHAFDYSNWPYSVTETISGGPFDRPYVITRDTPAVDAGKLAGLYVGTVAEPDADYAATYHYDPATARLERVTGPGLPGGTGGEHGARYVYHAGSDLVQQIRYQKDGGASNIVAQVTRTYEPDRDLVSTIENQWFENITDPNSLGLISSYTYTNDALGRRTAMGCAGDVFASPHAWAYWYNDRNELTDAARTDVGDWAYRYDPMGNRRSASEPGTELEAYSANALNQYTRTQQPLREPEVRAYEHDADGNLARVRLAVDVAGADGLVDAGDFELFAGCMAGPGVTAPPGGVDPDDFANCDFDGDGDVDLADFAAVPRAMGQVDTGSTYAWNAENRLMSVARTYPALADPNEPPPVKVEFVYDYLGRRIEKRVLPWNPALDGGAGGWDAVHPTKVTRFVWSGWLMLLELDGLSDCGTPGSPAECVVRKYTWGLDLAGQNGQVNSLESAGAISGLLAAYDPAANLPLWYFYDANGNVGQVLTMISVDGENYGIIPAARYEYDPYGNRVNEPASGEYEQPFQFSTKQRDPETGLLCFGYRYSDGIRWLSRDPLEEAAGLNLYRAFANSPVTLYDPLGLQEPRTLDEILDLVRRMIAEARKKGANVAADNLEHWLNGSGADRILDWNWLRSYSVVQDAEKANRDRFADSLRREAENLKPGETKVFCDYWDRKATAPMLTDLYYASGTFTITSYGCFTLSRGSDCKVRITGSVDHLFWDPYDWHPGLAAWVPGFGVIEDADLARLEAAGYGKEFVMKSLWHQDVTGEFCAKSLWFDSFSLDWGAPAGGGAGVMERVIAEKPAAKRPKDSSPPPPPPPSSGGGRR